MLSLLCRRLDHSILVMRTGAVNSAEIAQRCERIEADAWIAIHGALSPAYRGALEIEAERSGAALSLMSPRFDTAMLNRTHGLGLDEPLSETAHNRLCDAYVRSPAVRL